MCASTLGLDTESQVGRLHRCGDVDGEEPFPSSFNPVPPSPPAAGGKVSLGNDTRWPERRAWEGGRVDRDTHRRTGKSSGSGGSSLATFTL